MTQKEQYKKRYQHGDAPWDIGRPDFNLVEIVTRRSIPGCSALDIGCGTGDNAIWLAGNDFDITGLEVSEEALEKAWEKALHEGVECQFLLLDFFQSSIPGAPFGFAFDRGCFHSFSSEQDRKKFAENVAGHLMDEGLWLTLVGNSDENRDDPGPPQRSASDIVLAVEPLFEILLLESTVFGSNSQNPPRAWRCLMKKRSL